MADTTMFTKYAEQNCMQGLLDWLESGTVELHLIKSDFTLNIDTAGFNSLSVTEADFDGYVEQELAFGSLTLDANKKAQISASGVTFTMDGSNGNTIYGWWIQNTITGMTYIVEAKKYSQSSPDNRKDMTVSGNTLSISPKIKLFDTSISP